MGARLVSLATLALSFISSSGGSPWAAAAEPPLAKAERPPEGASATQAATGKIDERAKQILDKAASNLMAIGSIEFRAERDMELSYPKDSVPWKDLPSHVKDGYMFRCDGETWRIDGFLEGGSPSDSYSFNGKMFQHLSAEFSTFVESNHRLHPGAQTPFPHPISEAYDWVFPVKDGYLSANWDELRNRENWNAIATRAKLVGDAKSETAIETVELWQTSRSGQTSRQCSIDFDKEHGYEPVSWSIKVPERNYFRTAVVKRWANVEIESGRRVWLPVEASFEEPFLKGTVRIVESTLRVNQPIAEEVFTLPRSAAKHILGPVALDERTADFFKMRGPLAERLATAQDDARLNHQRVLVIFGDPDAEISQRLFEVREKNWRRALYEYQQLPIGKNDAAAIDEFRKKYPDVTEINWPSFVVLDEQGKALDSLTLASTSAGLTKDSGTTEAFLHQHALESPDAERLLADALAKAKQEDKKVFLQETGIYCAPCRRLSRFFEKHASVLDQHFVYLKIDAPRSMNGPEVIRRLRTDGSVGIPWIAILDQDGTVVKTELGFPSHEPKEIDEFIAMLSK